MGVVILVVSRMAAKGSVDVEEAKGKYMEQFQVLSEDYAKLAQETREAQVGIRADIASLQQQSREAQAAVVADVNRLAHSVESIEAMMRDVG
jgi:predicted YcjX-like family ATPase